MVLVGDELLSINHGDQDSEKTTSRNSRENLAICVERTNRESALTHVQKALSDAYHEQRVLIAVIVTGELSQKLSQTSIVRTGANKAHGEDSVNGNVVIIIVRISG